MSLPSQLEPPAVGREGAPQPRRVLLVAWEYPGAHSRRGTALARRVGQVARGLAALGWKVSVIHRRQREDDPAAVQPVEETVAGGYTVRRRAVAGPTAESSLPGWMAPVRKLSTLWTAFRLGDRSGRWANAALRSIEASGEEAPAAVLAFFTPRGPLAVASALHDAHGMPWFADFQDPWWEGTSAWLRPIVARWMRKTLRSAAGIVQVSPEWARRDAEVLGREVSVVRHAVPVRDTARRPVSAPRRDGPLRVLYVGSLNPDQQDLAPFMDALALVRAEKGVRRPVEVQIAGGEESWRLFETAAKVRAISNAVRWLGWLTASDLQAAIDQADLLLLIPMFPTHRQGVPSKLFEYVAYDTPVLIAGSDSGGMASVLDEWGHPQIVARTADEIADALRRAARGDSSGLLARSRCAIEPVTEDGLARWYSERMHRVLGDSLTCAE